MRSLGELMRDRSGQMTVELAATVPVMLVMAFTIANLMGFVEACAAFDRIAPAVVASYGVSASGEYTADAQAGRIRDEIVRELARGRTCEVEVSPEQRGRFTAPGATFSIGPSFTRYVCTLRYRPWPHSFVIAGVAFDMPAFLRHESSLVVDRYRPGVVI